jgi:tRNA (guanine10-N2)-dimethyltransferase
MKLLFEISGENATLPFSELGCIGPVLDQRLQVAVVDARNPQEIDRLAMTHFVLEYLGECDPELPAFKQLLCDLAISTTVPFAGRAKKVHGGSNERNPCSQKAFERMIGTMVDGPVSLSHPEVVYRAILSEDRCYFGRVIRSFDRGTFDHRNPGKRDFFHPGVMMPRMARALVNIARARSGDILLDPFCGTGGILIEADLLGMHAIGSDFDPLMIDGCRRNLQSASLMLADAAHLPFADHSLDSVVTDFPYGQSVCIRKADSMDQLYAASIEEIRRVLRPGRRAVIVTHRDISAIAGRFMTVLEKHEQRVHKSLTRRVLVLCHSPHGEC